MTAASQAIDRIAEATDSLPGTVFRAARFLRERDVDLWPQGSQGRGQEAHVDAHHLVNIALALAAADPIINAPAVAAELRDMVPLQDDTNDPPILPGATLGEALDLHVACLAASENRGRDTRDWSQVTVFTGPQFHARIYGRQESGLKITYYLPRRFAKMTDMRDSLLRREVTLQHKLFLLLSDIYGDTLEYRAKLLAQTERRFSARKTVARA